MSNSPAVLEGYLGLSGVLDHGAIGPELAERLALIVSEANGCDYCLASHGTLAGHLGISPEEIRAARRAGSSDPRIDVALKFALAGSIGEATSPTGTSPGSRRPDTPTARSPRSWPTSPGRS